MKEHFLGTFYGEDLVLKSDIESDWGKKWESWLADTKRQAVDEYKTELFLQELKNRQSFFKKLFRIKH